MGPYLSLFSIEVEHGFFSDGLWRNLRFVPSLNTRTLIDRAGMIVRKTENGFELYYDQSRTEALTLLLEELEGEFSFGFKVYVDDEGFKIYSEVCTDSNDQLPYFDNEHCIPDGERTRLHLEEQVSDKDMLPIASEALSDLLNRRDWFVRPAFAFKIVIRPTGNGSLKNIMGNDSPRYFLRFGPRQTYWTYYLLGAFASMRTTIVDLDDGVGFESPKRVSLSDKRSALVFRSKVEIPLRQHSACRFQLREAGANRSRILVRRLPVAAVGQINQHIINGNVVSVSEIYVNS